MLYIWIISLRIDIKTRRNHPEEILHFFLVLPKVVFCRIQFFSTTFIVWELSKINTLMIENMQIMIFTIMKFVPKTTLLQPSIFKFQLLCICCAGILHFYHYVFVIFVSLVARYLLYLLYIFVIFVSLVARYL